MRSSAGGTSGWSEDSGGGSVCSTAPITVRGRRPLECSPPRGHLVDDRAEGEDVTSRVGLVTGELFGRHVRKRAEHRARGGQWLSPGGDSVDRASRSGVAAASRAPKSSSFAPDLVNITLPGFRSRWTSPRRCA